VKYAWSWRCNFECNIELGKPTVEKREKREAAGYLVNHSVPTSSDFSLLGEILRDGL